MPPLKMIGHNTLDLCPATVQLAIDFWLRETQFAEHAMPIVKQVSPKPGPGGEWSLLVTLTDKES